jgi:hypothetical protein
VNFIIRDTLAHCRAADVQPRGTMGPRALHISSQIHAPGH